MYYLAQGFVRFVINVKANGKNNVKNVMNNSNEKNNNNGKNNSNLNNIVNVNNVL